MPAYNNEKQFHPRINNWLGYIVTIDNTTYYIAGDTDITEEANNIKCDIAFIPISGHFTMDVKEATELVKRINPKIVIPIHYGSIIGEPTYGKVLKENLSNTNIKVIEKLQF
ncbi:MAG: MBL fold metallo-hydrolase [Bacilli bacterium]|nr:MAG: MBL fold metallo-hydrolase [Bacilli bacterium]